jgi:TolB-like protein/lipoprotein NlpI
MPHALDEAVQRMLRKDSGERYGDMDSLIKDLKSAQAGLAASTTPKEKASPSIAVLPFVNMSADPDQEYFCDGLAEDLINALTQLSDVRVIARTSAFSFKGKNIDVRDIGKKLNVQSVLEGSVRKMENRLRITAQLVDATSGHHLWSEQYNREMEDIFAIQDEITMVIVDKLKPKLLGEEKERIDKRQAVDLQAYNLYLRGLWFANKRTGEGFEIAIECFEQVTEKEPEYALAYAGLAQCYIQRPIDLSLPTKDDYQRAREAALKAIEIEDTLAEAHTCLAVVQKAYDWDWKSATERFNRAIELNPGYARGHSQYAAHLQHMGHHDVAIEEAQLALELDPLSLQANELAGITLLVAGRYDQAIESFRNAIELDPNYPHLRIYLGWALLRKNKYEEAVAELEKEAEISKSWDPFVEASIGSFHAFVGKREKAEAALRNLLERSKKRYVPPGFIATLYFLLGKNDQGFEWLEKAYEVRDFWLVTLKTNMVFDSVHSDPRYIAMLKKIGLDK